MDTAFARVDGEPTIVAGPPIGGRGTEWSGCEWPLSACGGPSSPSEEDAYASIPGGRLADTTSGASLSEPESVSASEPKGDDAAIDADCTLNRGSVSFFAGAGDGDGWARAWDWWKWD